MDPSQIYASSLGGLLLLFMIYSIIHYLWKRVRLGRILLRAVKTLHRQILFLIFKHLVYPFVFRRRFIFPPLSRYVLLLQIIYWGGTIACNIISVPTLSSAGSRAANLAVANLVPLLLTGRSSLAADLLSGLIFIYTELLAS